MAAGMIKKGVVLKTTPLMPIRNGRQLKHMVARAALYG